MNLKGFIYSIFVIKFRISIKNIQRSFIPNHQVTHTPKDIMVKSEGSRIKDSVNKPKNSPNPTKWQKRVEKLR